MLDFSCLNSRQGHIHEHYITPFSQKNKKHTAAEVSVQENTLILTGFLMSIVAFEHLSFISFLNLNGISVFS